MAVQEAAALKDQGNKRFMRGDYGGAEALYSQA
jgi:hypothetical protein